MLDLSSVHQNILAEGGVDGLSRHKLMWIPTGKGGRVGLWPVTTLKNYFCMSETTRLQFFSPDIKLKHGNTSPAIILPSRMKILLLLSISLLPSITVMEEGITDLCQGSFWVLFFLPVGKRWVCSCNSVSFSVSLYLWKGKCVGTQILGRTAAANLSWAAVVLKIRRGEPKGNFIPRALEEHNRNCHVFVQNFWQKPPSSICWLPKC